MRVMLFGVLAERAGTDRVEVQATSLAGLRRQLEQHITGLSQLSYAIAVDRVLVNGDRTLSGSEEIALLPPFAGG